MPKIRIYELARELGLSNEECLELCTELKIGVKSHSSNIELPMADRVRRLADAKGLRRAPIGEQPAKIVSEPTGRTRRDTRPINTPVGAQARPDEVSAATEEWFSPQPSDGPHLETARPRLVHEAALPTSASEVGDGEWAALLSEVSHRRNVLERDLRDFVITVVRTRCGESDRTPADVVTSALSPDRRSLLADLKTRDLMKRLYWTELVNVVKRDWNWFEIYFGDRQQLILQADIVNERPDAHAKDFDGAELALQRRAIAWLEARIHGAGVL